MFANIGKTKFGAFSYIGLGQTCDFQVVSLRNQLGFNGECHTSARGQCQSKCNTTVVSRLRNISLRDRLIKVRCNIFFCNMDFLVLALCAEMTNDFINLVLDVTDTVSDTVLVYQCFDCCIVDGHRKLVFAVDFGDYIVTNDLCALRTIIAIQIDNGIKTIVKIR